MSRRVVHMLAIAGVLGVGAFAVPTAFADQELVSPDARDARQLTYHPIRVADLRSADAKDAAGNPRAYRTPVVVDVSSSRGFDWGDAGIGAGGMLAVVAIVAGGTLLIIRRRPVAIQGSIRQRYVEVHDGLYHAPKIARGTEDTMRTTVWKRIARRSPNRRHHMRIPGRRAAWAGAVLLIAGGGGIAFAAVPDSGNVYHACMLKATLTTRMIDPSLPSDSPLGHCTRLETEITWNQKGSPGAPGAAGKDGKDGVSVQSADAETVAPGTAASAAFDSSTRNLHLKIPQGETGAKGEKGESGADGAPGVRGDKGETGADGAPGPKGDMGDPGPQGIQGPPGSSDVDAWVAWRDLNRSVLKASPGTTVAEFAPGIYNVTLGLPNSLPFQPVCAVNASINNDFENSVPAVITASHPLNRTLVVHIRDATTGGSIGRDWSLTAVGCS
jgi:hypothetical protein